MSLKELLCLRKLHSSEEGTLRVRFFKYLESLNKKPRTRSINELHPSEIAKGFCPREWCILQSHIDLYNFHVPPKTRIAFDVGSALHEMMQNYLADMGVLIGYYRCKECRHVTQSIGKKPGVCSKCDCHVFEYKEITIVNKLWNIFGHCDGLVEMDGKLYLFEFKTSRSDVLRGMVKPLDWHVNQARIYMWSYNIMRQEQRELYEQNTSDITEETYYFYRRPIEGMIIWYLDKNYSDIVDFNGSIIRFDMEAETYIESLKVQILKCLDFIKTGVLPEPCCSKRNLAEGLAFMGSSGSKCRVSDYCV